MTAILCLARNLRTQNGVTKCGLWTWQ